MKSETGRNKINNQTKNKNQWKAQEAHWGSETQTFSHKAVSYKHKKRKCNKNAKDAYRNSEVLTNFIN